MISRVECEGDTAVTMVSYGRDTAVTSGGYGEDTAPVRIRVGWIGQQIHPVYPTVLWDINNRKSAVL